MASSVSRRLLAASSPWAITRAGIKRYPFPVTFESGSSACCHILTLDVVFPPDGEMKLSKMPSEPVYDTERGEKKYKVAFVLGE